MAGRWNEPGRERDEPTMQGRLLAATARLERDLAEQKEATTRAIAALDRHVDRALKIAGWLAVFVLTSGLAGLVWLIETTTTQTERQNRYASELAGHANAPGHGATLDLQSDVRALVVEVREQRKATDGVLSEIRARLERLEERPTRRR